MITLVSPAEERVILHDVSWATYERLLADFANQSAPHLPFDRGALEIMTPLPEHEKYNRLIALLVAVVSDALGINMADFGSTTFKRPDLERGLQPQHPALHAGRNHRPGSRLERWRDADQEVHEPADRPGGQQRRRVAVLRPSAGHSAPGQTAGSA